MLCNVSYLTFMMWPSEDAVGPYELGRLRTADWDDPSENEPYVAIVGNANANSTPRNRRACCIHVLRCALLLRLSLEIPQRRQRVFELGLQFILGLVDGVAGEGFGGGDDGAGQGRLEGSLVDAHDPAGGSAPEDAGAGIQRVHGRGHGEAEAGPAIERVG